MSKNWTINIQPNNASESNINQSLLETNLPVQSCSDMTSIPGIVSDETMIALDNFNTDYRVIHGYVAVAVCLFGVLSNSANIVVLTRKNMASSTNTILLWLAVADLLTMLDYLPFAIKFDIMRSRYISPEFAWRCFFLFHVNFVVVCHTVAIWLTIALAIFRYIYICKPTRDSYYCSQQRACRVVVTIFVLTVIICIPNCAVNMYNYHFRSAITYLNNFTTSGYLNSTASSLYYPEWPAYLVISLVNNWIQAILIKVVPCFMLVTLTLLLLHAMHNAYRKRMKLKSQGRRTESDKHGEHNRTTGMLLAVVVLFTITELPQGVLTLMNIFIECFSQAVYSNLGDLMDIITLINTSINFVFYCTMSKQFRTTFASIFCPRKTSWANGKAYTNRFKVC